jgi:rhodanese-related sulfurtransferase
MRGAGLSAATLVSLLLVTGVSGQEPKRVFVDGELVEDFEYVLEFMPPEVLKRHIDQKSDRIVIVDTAATLIWEEEHIPGAISVPWVRELVPPVPLPRDRTLVIYCACKNHEDSVDMAKKLSHLGYLDVKVLEGGWFKWLELGYATAGTAQKGKQSK